MKKTLSIILAIILAFTCTPFSVLAADNHSHTYKTVMSDDSSYEYTYCSSKATHNVEYSLEKYPESSHSYSNKINEEYTYSCPNATALEIRFSALCKTEKDYDIITIFDSNGKTVGTYSGDELAGKTVKINGDSFRIVFTSDRSKTFYGFSIDSIYAYDGDFSYYVPSVEKIGTAHNYSNNANEKYYYYCPGAESISVKFSQNTMTEKNYDIIKIYNEKGSLAGTYSGNQLAGKTITLQGSSFSIQFTSDHSKTFYGFSIDSISANISRATANVPNQSYTLTVPKEMYPESSHNYENNSKLNYGFRYPNATALSVTFSSETKTEEKYDLISIYDENGALVGTYSGTQLAGLTVEIPTGSFRISLTSDHSKNFYGFSIDSIVATMNSNPDVTSEKYSNTYFTNALPCTSNNYTDNTDETFYYTDAYASSIDIQFASGCFTEKNYDIVSVYDENNVLVGEFSGDQLANKFLHINGSSFSIRFTSDHSKNFYGYAIRYLSPNYTSKNEGSNIYTYPKTNHYYENYSNKTYEFSYPKTNVDYLEVTFTPQTFTEKNYDFVYIYDKSGSLVGKYSGNELSAKTVKVPGNYFKIKFTSDRTTRYYGFEVCDITAVFDSDYYSEKEIKHNYVLTNTVRPGESTKEAQYYTCKNCLDFCQISNLDFQSFTYTLSEISFEYDGNTHKPDVLIKNGSTVLNMDVDYKLTYPSSPVNSGYYSIKVDFIGKYSGTKYLYYTIKTHNDSDTSSYRQYLREQGFPESYINSLAALHLKYPNWEFKVYNTNMDWQTAVNGERTPHSQQRIMIGENVSDDFYCYCSACTDKYGNKIVKDSSYAASEKAVKYYMDPRNWLDEKHIFQFETTNGGEGQTKEGVEAILKGTWMYDSYIYYHTTEGDYILYDSTLKYSDAIMRAAASSGLAPYYIASKIKQEVGSSTASYAGGSNGTTAPFQGIYNYFNIGAYAGARDGLAWAAGFLKVKDGGTASFYGSYENGKGTSFIKTLDSSQRMVYIGTYGNYFKVRLYWENGNNSYKTGAVGYVLQSELRKTYIGTDKGGNDKYYRPWTTPYRAIVHGSRYVYDNFGVYQYTGYLQKFNVTPNQTHSHEYMVNISSAQAEGAKIYTAYSNTGLLNQKHIFYIPVYKNM